MKSRPTRTWKSCGGLIRKSSPMPPICRGIRPWNPAEVIERQTGILCSAALCSIRQCYGYACNRHQIQYKYIIDNNEMECLRLTSLLCQNQGSDLSAIRVVKAAGAFVLFTKPQRFYLAYYPCQKKSVRRQKGDTMEAQMTDRAVPRQRGHQHAAVFAAGDRPAG